MDDQIFIFFDAANEAISYQAVIRGMRFQEKPVLDDDDKVLKRIENLHQTLDNRLLVWYPSPSSEMGGERKVAFLRLSDGFVRCEQSIALNKDKIKGFVNLTVTGDGTLVYGKQISGGAAELKTFMTKIWQEN